MVHLIVLLSVVSLLRVQGYSISRYPNGDELKGENCQFYTNSKNCKCSQNGTVFERGPNNSLFACVVAPGSVPLGKSC